MKFFSTNSKSEKVGFREAVLKSLPSDNGLFFPEKIPSLSQGFLNEINVSSIDEMAFNVLNPFCSEDLSKQKLVEIIDDTFIFDIPLESVSESINCLELFHGPTMAFKDVGARFLARTLSYFKEHDEKETTILVATSGDTGGAVASGFHNQPGINVVILYPSGKVTQLQEQQMTTLGCNIRALEVDGNFDDCQAMVKQAFLDKDLKQQNLSSANSINIARWLPQSVYYYVPFMEKGLVEDLVFSVPSGNFGNITSGMLAKKMGLPIKRFIAATNSNDVVPRYLSSGNYEPHDTIQTIANAMDVSRPSNFPRLQAIYGDSFASIVNDTKGYVMDDTSIRNTIRQCYEKNEYVLDPHSAIAYAGLKSNLEEGEDGVFIGTAHHCKFLPAMEQALDSKIELPDFVGDLMKKEKVATPMPVDYSEFKAYLMD